jgi:hypothetical protein
MSTLTPKARKERLVTRELPEELLVYDLDRHKASCLNRMAMATWRRCDGQATVPEIAEALRGELGIPVDEPAVWLALERLSRAHLLEEPVVLPRWAEGYSRREWVASVARVSAVLVPAVVSILSPMAASAASALSKTACEARNTGGCNSDPCVTVPTRCILGVDKSGNPKCMCS